ncbi:MAG: alanine racemase [Clostridia bacterium]|nr:alanine racemase [Clostridia bacterium]
MKIYRQAWLEISTAAIARNCALVRARTPENARVMAVVKADGYGHGAVQAAKAALGHGASFLGVSSPEEGMQLRLAGLRSPVLVLGGIARDGAEPVVRYDLTQTVFDTNTVRFLEEAAAKAGKVVDIHIKIDTGMGRIGVRDGMETAKIAALVRASPHLRLAGAFTHFADADGADLCYTSAQAERFQKLALPLGPGLLLHAANSAALLRSPELSFGMVRAGIALYCDPGLPDGTSDGFMPAMRWAARAVCVRELQEGAYIGYGCTYRTKRLTRVMTVPVGYADGYHRTIGNRGRALVRGQSAPVIGAVCMDQMMLDVTNVRDARVGDEVVLLGAQGGERITVREMADWCGMIDYEILLSPTQRIPRVYIDESEESCNEQMATG